MGPIDLFQNTRDLYGNETAGGRSGQGRNLQGLRRRTEGVCLRQESVCVPALRRYGRLLARTRIRQIADKDSFEELYANLAPADPDPLPGYAEKTAELAEKVGMPDAVKTGVCKIGGVETAIGVMDSHFMMASMGSVVGES